jgi:hypothetical protein
MRVFVRIFIGAAMALAFAIAPATVLAQSERGTISGTVRDTSGAVVPGARVTVTNMATNSVVSLASLESGDFTAPNLGVGQYAVRVEKEGFRPAVVSNITVNAATNVRTDVTLEIGTSQQVVEVQADAVQLSTESAKASVTVTNRLVDELPLVVGGAMRSPFDLAQLTPESKNVGGDNGFILGGGQAASYTATLDGVSANTTRALTVSWVATNAPSLEAITEFTVDTNGFKAEYGHSGGGVMTFVSKSGTNDLHGSAYEFLRNNDFDANWFFSNSRGIPRPIYKQHDFGASGGGPVLIPKLYNGKNKTFFFAAFEGFRNRTGANASAFNVPTPEMYTGDFSKWVNAAGAVIPIYDPTSQKTDASGAVTRTPFANNQVPQSLFDPLSVKAVNVYQQTSGVLKPNNNAAPGTLAYVSSNYLVTKGTTVSPYTKFSIKGDHVFSEKNRLAGYYGYNRQSWVAGPEGDPNLPGFYTTFNDLQQASDVFRMSWDHTFRPTLFNHFYAGGNNWRQDHKPPAEYAGNWKDKFCLPNVPDCNYNMVNLSFSNFSSWGGPADNGSENTIYSFNNDLSWIKGKHQFKFGGMYQRSHYNGFGRQCVSGCADFNFGGTGRAGDTNFSTAGGNGFASFLLGWANYGSLDTPRFIGQQWPYFAGYAQDDWRISPKLVLNLGLRWETTLPPVEAQDRWSDFSPTTPNPGAGGILGALIYAGSGTGRQGSRTLADSYFKGFGPHVGFAYNPNAKTVIRGSYALSYSAITTTSGSTHQKGFTLTTGFSNSSNNIQPTFLFKNGLPPWTAPPFIDPSFSNLQGIPWWQGHEATRPPEIHNFSLSIQRQITSTFLVEGGYSGVLGTHLVSGLLQYDQINPSYLNTLGISLLTQAFDSAAAVAAGIRAPYPNFKSDWGSRATVNRALRPYPQYDGIDTSAGGGDHSGHSTYHAGMLRVEKRYGHGLTFQSSYVFSKLLTDSDSYWFGSAAMDFFNRGLEKSIGNYDVTHNFKLGLVYELPFGKGKPMLSRGPAVAVLGNWRLGVTNYYSSGLPIGVGTTFSLPIFNGGTKPYVTSYDGWRAATKGGSFDPQVDNFFVPYGAGPFPLQGTGTSLNGMGNQTRYNPKVRQFPNYNENLSIAKSFPIKEQIRLDFRAEFFNAFNRVRFGTGSATLQSQTFGRLTSNSDIMNNPRQMQFALKLYF